MEELKTSEFPFPIVSEKIYVARKGHHNIDEGDGLRIHYDETLKAYQTQRTEYYDGVYEQLNGSIYPHFQDAANEFMVWIRNTDAVPDDEAEYVLAEKEEEPTPAPVEEEPAEIEAFDYSAFPEQTAATLRSAEALYRNGQRIAATGIRQMADAVGIAHDELVANCEKQNDTKTDINETNPVVQVYPCKNYTSKKLHGNRYSEKTFLSWCNYIGLKQGSAYNLLRVSQMFSESTPSEQKVLEDLSPSLLYAAARPSAPPELVEKVKSGEITTNKQYQELLEENRKLRMDCSSLSSRVEMAEKGESKANRKMSEQSEELAASKRMVEMLRDQNMKYRNIESDRDAWQARAEAAENRPVEVAVDETATEERAKAMADEMAKSAMDRANEIMAEAEQVKRESEQAIQRMREQMDKPQDTEDIVLLNRYGYDAKICFLRMLSGAWNMSKDAISRMRGYDKISVKNDIMEELKRIGDELCL